MSLQVWLPLTGHLNNQGLSNVTVTNNGATVDNNGKIGKCYSFNSSVYLNETNIDWTNFNTLEFSLCCWYKEPSPVASGNSQIICIGTGSGWNNIRIGLLRRVTNGYPMFSVSDGSSYIGYNCTATSFSLDVWNHIVVTYNNGEIKMYINGVLDKTYSTTITPVLNSSQHLGIGAASNGAERLTGLLNDVRIYDHALSAKEVKELSKGLVLHYPLSNNGCGLIDYGDNLEYDVSGYNNHGTKTGTINYSSDSARYAACSNFPSNTSHISRNLSLSSGFANSYTFAWWGKLNTSYTYGPMFWGYSDGNRLNVYNDPTHMCWNTSDGVANTFGSEVPRLDNQWHHYAVTGNGSVAKLYIDGNYKANAKSYKAITGSNLCFNGWSTTADKYAFNNKISDFRFYATPLTDEDIAELYNTAASLANNGTLFAYEYVET